jgi:hypothetical protein
MTDGFLDRWSRRKAQARDGKPLPEPLAALPDPEPLPPPDAGAPTAAAAAAVRPAAPAPPPLTLDDVQALTPESNFTRFMASGVAPEVRNAAMKKLFADPHYNVMDGLDTYIDDYSRPDPIPASVLRRMAGADLLKPADDRRGDGTAVRDDADNPTSRSVAQCIEAQPTKEESSQPAPVQTLAFEGVPGPSPADHADTDMRLQPDHAARAEGDRRGPP